MPAEASFVLKTGWEFAEKVGRTTNKCAATTGATGA
jgi:hypothetical protein